MEQCKRNAELLVVIVHVVQRDTVNAFLRLDVAFMRN